MSELSNPRALIRKRIEQIYETIDQGDFYAARRSLEKLEVRALKADLTSEEEALIEGLRERLKLDFSEWFVPVSLFTLWACLVWLTLPHNP